MRILTEALRVELSTNRADAGLARLSLKQAPVELFLEGDDLEPGGGRARHLLDPHRTFVRPLSTTPISGIIGVARQVLNL